jgi:hypothetical protein
MSYDLAVWEGERPDDDEAAMKFYMERIVPQLEEYDPKNPITPTPRIRAYVEALLECWPDIQAEAAPLKLVSSSHCSESAGFDSYRHSSS